MATEIGVQLHVVRQGNAGQIAGIHPCFLQRGDALRVDGPEGDVMALGKADRQRGSPGACAQNGKLHRPQTSSMRMNPVSPSRCLTLIQPVLVFSSKLSSNPGLARKSIGDLASASR